MDPDPGSQMDKVNCSYTSSSNKKPNKNASSPFFLIFCLFFWLPSVKSEVSDNINNSEGINVSKPGCLNKCGNVTVPYPFGFGPNCSHSSGFEVYCDTSVDPPDIRLSAPDNYRLNDISDSEVRIRIPYFTSNCRPQDSFGYPSLALDFSDTPFTLSDANKLTSIGCSDPVTLNGFSQQYSSHSNTKNNFASGCISICTNGDQSLNGSCPGNGCCQIPVPKGTVSLAASISSDRDRMWDVGNRPCSYSFLGEQDSFQLEDVSDLYRPPISIREWIGSVPVVLDWRIGTENCSVASEETDSFICQENSVCVDSDAGVGGYRCRCLDGYEGNPYLPPGCKNIDECESNPCHSTGICINQLGNYKCECPRGYAGDGRRDGAGCIQIHSSLSKASIGAIFSIGFLALLSISFLLIKFLKKVKTKMQKHIFFIQNGGLLLQKQTSSNKGILGQTRIFTAKELERATNRFNETRILGRGSQGAVYKGMLSDGQIVVIKKAQFLYKGKSKYLVEQFINEVVVLSQIDHKNVVKLLGCCLETKIPLLVYEFVPNGTLSYHIHDANNTEFPISLNMRLKIAADVAGALSYLHNATSLPIFHRGIKSSTILLDEKYVAKVSDFRTSDSVAVDPAHLTINMNGTVEYIDPEYFRSSQFTEKSDVYSFGVVLVELLTGLKPLTPSNDADEGRSLVSRFLSATKEKNLDSVLDIQVAVQGAKEEVLAVAKLAARCLNLNGRKRPSMKEVAMQLESVRAKLLSGCSLPEAAPTILTMDYDYNWTNTGDFVSLSASDLYPILYDRK